MTVWIQLNETNCSINTRKLINTKLIILIYFIFIHGTSLRMRWSTNRMLFLVEISRWKENEMIILKTIEMKFELNEIYWNDRDRFN